jgi:predicted membrane protein
MSEKTSWHVSLIGGFKGVGRWRMDARTVVVALVGGADLDLREAELTTTGLVVTKVSLVGGVKLTVPPGVNVDVSGVSLFGGRSIQAPVNESARTTVHIRSYGIFGGVRVQPSAT